MSLRPSYWQSYRCIRSNVREHLSSIYLAAEGNNSNCYKANDAIRAVNDTGDISLLEANDVVYDYEFAEGAYDTKLADGAIDDELAGDGQNVNIAESLLHHYTHAADSDGQHSNTFSVSSNSSLDSEFIDTEEDVEETLRS